MLAKYQGSLYYLAQAERRRLVPGGARIQHQVARKLQNPFRRFPDSLHARAVVRVIVQVMGFME
jgi:hypothetical protein